MNAAELFPADVLADVCAVARDQHARSGRGALFVMPLADDDTGRLDSQYFQACQLLTLASLGDATNANARIVGITSRQVAAYDPQRQCVLLWMGEDGKIYCETVDDPSGDGRT